MEYKTVFQVAFYRQILRNPKKNLTRSLSPQTNIDGIFDIFFISSTVNLAFLMIPLYTKRFIKMVKKSESQYNILLWSYNNVIYIY